MDELFGALFEEAVGVLLFAPIGMAYLYLRYRSRARVKQVLTKEYEGQYSNAGSAVVLNTFAAFLAIAMFGLVLGALISPVIQWLRG